MALLTSKKTIIGAALALAGILSASLAVAAYKHKHHHKGDGYHGHMQKIHKLDQNDDDVISLSEFTTPAMTMFDALDTDQDGTISSTEFLARASKRFAKLDADNNGMIEGEEMPKRKRHGKDHKGEKRNKSAEAADQS